MGPLPNTSVGYYSNGVALAIKNIDVDDLAATNVSCTTLSVGGNPVSTTDTTALQTKTQNLSSSAVGTTGLTGTLEMTGALTVDSTIDTSDNINVASGKGLTIDGTMYYSGTVCGNTNTTAATFSSLSVANNLNIGNTKAYRINNIDIVTGTTIGRTTTAGTFSNVTLAGDLNRTPYVAPSAGTIGATIVATMTAVGSYSQSTVTDVSSTISLPEGKWLVTARLRFESGATSTNAHASLLLTDETNTQIMSTYASSPSVGTSVTPLGIQLTYIDTGGVATQRKLRASVSWTTSTMSSGTDARFSRFLATRIA